MKGDPKPKRYTGRPRNHVITHPSGAVLEIAIVCGLRYFTCARFPAIAAEFDGADDERVCDAIEEFMRRASGGAARADDEAKGAA